MVRLRGLLVGVAVAMVVRTLVAFPRLRLEPIPAFGRLSRRRGILEEGNPDPGRRRFRGVRRSGG
jgi:hypothetical protein